MVLVNIRTATVLRRVPVRGTQFAVGLFTVDRDAGVIRHDEMPTSPVLVTEAFLVAHIPMEVRGLSEPRGRHSVGLLGTRAWRDWAGEVS